MESLLVSSMTQRSMPMPMPPVGDFLAIDSDEEAVAAAKSIGVELPDTADKTWGNALYEVDPRTGPSCR